MKESFDAIKERELLYTYKLCGSLAQNKLYGKEEVVLALIPFDYKEITYLGLVEEYPEHAYLAEEAHINTLTFDNYFRIIFDNRSAEWTAVCPPAYKNYKDSLKMKDCFYKDGMQRISEILSDLGYKVDIKIPDRYYRTLY